MLMRNPELPGVPFDRSELGRIKTKFNSRLKRQFGERSALSFDELARLAEYLVQLDADLADGVLPSWL
jgi:hypothetical protein